MGAVNEHALEAVQTGDCSLPISLIVTKRQLLKLEQSCCHHIPLPAANTERKWGKIEEQPTSDQCARLISSHCMAEAGNVLLLQ